VGIYQMRDSLMMKAETLDLELKTFNQTRTERIFLTNNQTTAEYITDTLLSMMECDIDETVTRKLKERFSRELVEVCKR
jgi:hypothetical protein